MVFNIFKGCKFRHTVLKFKTFLQNHSLFINKSNRFNFITHLDYYSSINDKNFSKSLSKDLSVQKSLTVIELRYFTDTA